MTWTRFFSFKTVLTSIFSDWCRIKYMFFVIVILSEPVCFDRNSTKINGFIEWCFDFLINPFSTHKLYAWNAVKLLQNVSISSLFRILNCKKIMNPERLHPENWKLIYLNSIVPDVFAWSRFSHCVAIKHSKIYLTWSSFDRNSESLAVVP